MSSSLIDVIRQHAPAPSGTMPADREAYGLLEALARVPDPRDPRGVRYPLASVLAAAVCAVVAGLPRSRRSATGSMISTRRRGAGSGSPAGYRS
ncbi:transposase family protein [Micromonospora sp. LOL_023]|uniref:transposase family protein n=1 Tax=Micromonospora sp. LOL_023 TaxID=3345418 RepID=UPI003A8BC68F